MIAGKNAPMLSLLQSVKIPQFEKKNMAPWFRASSKKAFPKLKIAASRTTHFLKLCYVDGFRALVAARYDRRQACIIIAATIPALLSAGVLFIPTILFPTPEHKEYYHFARTLAEDSISMLPVALGAIATTLGLKIPLG